MHNLRFLIQNIFFWIPFRILCVFFADLRIWGSGNLKEIDQSRGVIFASNHYGQLDAILVALGLPFSSRFLPMYYVALEIKHYQRFPLGRFLYGGNLFKLLGAYPAKTGLKNYAVSLSSHVGLLRQGRSLCIFPEGQIIDPSARSKIRGGVSYLAEATGAVVVPVALVGIDNLTSWSFFTFRHKIRIVYGPPTTFSELYSEVITGIRKIDALTAVSREENSVLPSLAGPILGISSSERYKLVAANLMDRVSQLRRWYN